MVANLSIGKVVLFLIIYHCTACTKPNNSHCDTISLFSFSPSFSFSIPHACMHKEDRWKGVSGLGYRIPEFVPLPQLYFMTFHHLRGGGGGVQLPGYSVYLAYINNGRDL